MKRLFGCLFVLSWLTLADSVAFAKGALDLSSEARSGEIIVRIADGTSSTVIQQLAASANCEIVKPVAYMPGFYVLGVKGRPVTVTEAPVSDDTRIAIKALAKISLISSATPNWVFRKDDLKKSTGTVSRAQQPSSTKLTPNDPMYSRQRWHMDMIRASEAWNIQYMADPTKPIRVAVVDTGIDRTHPDFVDPITGQSRVVAAGDFIEGQPDVDGDGHGTHVAGTIAATTNNSVGVVGVGGWNNNGVNIQLIAAKGLNSAGGGSEDSVSSAIGFAVANGARVINASLGFNASQPSDVPLLSAAVAKAISSNVIFCATAGNNSTDADLGIKRYPGDLPGVIKVTAVGPGGVPAFYSNYGGGTQLRIAAPGGSGRSADENVISTYTRLNTSSLGLVGYEVLAGTSMACPHVAGCVALILAAGAPSSEVWNAISTTVSPINATSGIPAAKYGVGIIDLYSALYEFADPPPASNLELVGNGSSVASGASATVDRGASYFRATPISITLRGVGRIYASGPPSTISGLWSLESDVTVEVQTIGRTPSIVKAFIGGRGVAGQSGRIEIPTLPANASKSQRFTGIQVPAPNTDGTYTPLSLSPGQYKIVAKVNLRDSSGIVSTVESAQFLTVVEKRLTAGRTMFALPFKAGVLLRPATDPNLTPEAGIFGTSGVFSLARYNPLRTLSDDDYARFRANDPYNLRGAARFDARDQLDSRVITFDTTAPGVSIAPIGLGYWLDLDRAEAISTALLPYPGQIPGVSPVAENAIGVNAYASGGGWNMIGAPFTYPVDWSVVTIKVAGSVYSMAEAVKAGIISPALIGFGNGDYLYSIAPAGQLEPFNGYWIRVFHDCTILIPPVPSAVATRSQQASTGSDGWKARLIANVGGDRDGQNYFGQLRGAADTEDIQDILKPPAGAGHAYVRFTNANSEGKSRALAFDMRALSGNSVNRQEWIAEVATDRPNAAVVLSWDGIRSAPRNARLVLRDTVTGARVVMGSQSSYTYHSAEPGSSRKFVISLEPQASGGVLAIRNLRTVSAGRASGGWAVRFNTNTEAEVQGTITTLDGRSIGSLAGTGRAQAGSETILRWDGRNKDGGLVAAGPYKVQIKARTADGQIQVEQRVIQIVR